MNLLGNFCKTVSSGELSHNIPFSSRSHQVIRAGKKDFHSNSTDMHSIFHWKVAVELETD